MIDKELFSLVKRNYQTIQQLNDYVNLLKQVLVEKRIIEDEQKFDKDYTEFIKNMYNITVNVFLTKYNMEETNENN